VQQRGIFPFVFHHPICVEQSRLERNPLGLKSVHHGHVDTWTAPMPAHPPQAWWIAPTRGHHVAAQSTGNAISHDQPHDFCALALVFCRNQPTVHLRSKWFLF
jgi:hypothetical protein